MNSRRKAVFLAISLMSVSLSAQVTARQGEPTQDAEVTEFHSPMILEIPLTVADRALWGQGVIRTGNEIGMRKYTCDGISFADFAVSAVLRRREHDVKITFDSLLANQPGVDKLATLKFEIVRNGEIVAAKTVPGIDVEEGKTGANSTFMLVPERGLTESPSPTLRIRISVVENR